MSKPTYYELLRDPRWQRRRLEIMDRANFSCESCGDASSTLNVHHKIYRRGAMPWEYSDDELTCICETCHKADHDIRAMLAVSMARMTAYQLGELLGFAEGLEARVCAFDDPPAERSFPMRDEKHAKGFLSALWATGHILSTTTKKIVALSSLGPKEVYQLIIRGPVI